MKLNLELTKPQQEISRIVQFIQQVFANQGFDKAVIGVSGGIDSALALTLLTQAVGPNQVYPVFMPYGEQSVADSHLICQHNQIPPDQWQLVNIKPLVDRAAEELFVQGAEVAGGRYEQVLVSQKTEIVTDQRAGGGLDQQANIVPDQKFEVMVDQEVGSQKANKTRSKKNKAKKNKVVAGQATNQQPIRLGNIMARIRMIVLYDLAKKLTALVCGTENKSENMLGYFTRYGDEGCDLDPIVHLYKTQIRQLARNLQLPELFLTKPPSAGLWRGQTDEQELGYEYKQADMVLAALDNPEIQLSDLDLPQQLVTAVQKQVQKNQFKHQVPYKISQEKSAGLYQK
ncbi:MAG: NAD(+) synthase [Candidatus Pacebacteria bacterium]|nr:NAD(+) synthase [Candidatus Paceibacterota bacterium]